MRSWLVTLVIALAIPLTTLGLVTAAAEKLDGEWRAALEAEFGPITDEQFELNRLAALCQEPDAQAILGETCTIATTAGILRVAAIGAAALSVGLLGLIAAASILSRRDRRRLAQLFAPALYLVLAGIALLTVTSGALVVAGAYVVEAVYFGVTHIGITLPIAIVVGLAAFGIVRAMVSMTRRQPLIVDGREVDRAAQPRLFGFLDRVASASGGPVPEHVVVGLDPTFFVTESDVRSFDGTHAGRTLFLSAPLLHVLNETELGAVVGHEMGHFIGEDTAYSRRFYPIYRGTTESLQVLYASSGGLSGIPLLPPLKILGMFFESFATTERSLSRDRELAADAVGAKATSADAIATALMKLNLYTPSWDDTLVAAEGAALREHPIENAAEHFAERATVGAARSRLGDLDQDAIRHPFDSHPDLSSRLAALDLTASEVAESALTDQTGSAAIALLDGGPALEVDLTSRMHETTASRLRAIGAEPTPLEDGPAIRTAAAADPAIATAVRFVEQVRGQLATPVRVPKVWVAVAPLEIRPHPEPRAFGALVSETNMPGGDQFLVVGPANEATPEGLRLPAGTKLQLVGINDLTERRGGRDEDYFDVDGRLVVVRRFGDWPIAQQLAGLMVMPGSDAFLTGARAEDAAAVRDAAWNWRPARAMR